MFWKKKHQVKHLLSLLKTHEAWKVERIPVILIAPGNNKFESKLHERYRFELIDGEFIFYHTRHPTMLHAPPKYAISFPSSYNIELTNSEHRAILKAVRKLFNERKKCREQEKQSTFTSKLLK